MVMSLLTNFLTKFSILSKALTVANNANKKFVAYAKTDSYEALYEKVNELMTDTSKSGSEKMAIVLASFSSDVKVYGEFFIKAAVELILSETER